MTFTPDDPFPKEKGHAIRSKDWNDAIKEVRRLEDDKVDRADVRDRLVTRGDDHAHTDGAGATIKHSDLDHDDGTNPHGITAEELDALPTSGGTISGDLRVTGTIRGTLRTTTIDSGISEPIEPGDTLHKRSDGLIGSNQLPVAVLVSAQTIDEGSVEWTVSTSTFSSSLGAIVVLDVHFRNTSSVSRQIHYRILRLSVQ